ncbi:MAG: hypothetical protein COU63_03690 [Candidatus Pacebacteria bacterium CG10_big_fil_rev_8_21_14_0_10_36_11]|nr:hypothetical protein [Candidatus Pacearchaeota archaeon]OIP73872.1 MAG: hypothetical protein AUK08_04940 [Candidatus Pacebacteria bacterium CG2_30_36_39]PIR64564.1 MAG: hypothetical protein COU63_03690 [Candidatus Pacebacteria bacterium CG10_big_fil_rev_8_21_14_0_10_36_11]PJC42698.1 MAG: hypothetical protein CO040_03135 [Candidatus Pacebacteria bacterium CG_4_9_14_0_2_um_filter_36_8]
MLSILSLIAQNNTIDLGGFTPPTDAYSKGSGSSANGAQALKNLELFISNIIGFMTALGGIFFVIYFVLGAFEWISSGGDKGKVEKARNRMMNGAIGLVLMVAAYGIIGLLGSFVGLDLLNPAEQINQIYSTIK